MRASQYIAPIESDVEMWEDKLILIQDILDHLLQVGYYNYYYYYCTILLKVRGIPELFNFLEL